MYIRRKVFSQVENWDNEMEKEERLYSTGDAELDELLERAFCEGYEFAQKEFGYKEAYQEFKDAVKGSLNKGKEKAKEGYGKAKAYVGKHLGKEGTVATKVSGWAKAAGEKMSAKEVDTASEKFVDLVKKFQGEGLTKKAAEEKALKKMGDNKIVAGAKKAGRWVAGKVEKNPRAAAGIAAGTLAAGVGGGIYAAKHKKD